MRRCVQHVDGYQTPFAVAVIEAGTVLGLQCAYATCIITEIIWRRANGSGVDAKCETVFHVSVFHMSITCYGISILAIDA